MKYVFEEFKIVDGAHHIDATLELEEGETPNTDCPFWRNSMDVVDISSFELDPMQTSIVVRSSGGGYSIPISMIGAVANFADPPVPIIDPTAEQVYDFFSIAKGYY